MFIILQFNEISKEIEISENTTALNLMKQHFNNLNILACSISKDPKETKLCDLTQILQDLDFVKFYDFSSKEGKHVFWHSSAHILGNALVNLYNCKLVNGPPIEEGFYYDIDIATPITESMFKDIEKEMMNLIKKCIRFVREEHKKIDLEKFYIENLCKLHFVRNVSDETITAYRNVVANGNNTNGFLDMCRGPHILGSKLIKAVKILKTSSCYFLNDSSNKSLQRIYAITFPSKELMNEYQEKIRKAKEMDHRKIGREMDLFFFHDYSPGSCFWLPDGAYIYNKLQTFLRSEYVKRNFQEVITPNIFHTDLWKESGHYDCYKDNIYMIQEEEFALKPMNCPGHCLMFRSDERSYKELPFRLADFGVLHRNECSGSLTGLTRVRRFQQDDAHVFLMRSQVKDEIVGCLQFLKDVYSVFGFKYELFLSTRPEKFMGQVEEWDEAEEALKQAMELTGHKFSLNEGDGAFYGPKIDIILFDALGRKNQCATIQLDFQLPQRFKLKYKNENGGFDTPVIIHRAILGSVERFVAILIESFGKRLPFWISPRQIGLVCVSEENSDYARELLYVFRDFKVRLYSDSKDTLNKKIRKAETDGCRIVLVLGKKEQEKEEVNVRFEGKNGNFKVHEFLRICSEADKTMKEPSINFE